MTGPCKHGTEARDPYQCETCLRIARDVARMMTGHIFGAVIFAVIFNVALIDTPHGIIARLIRHPREGE